MLSYPKMADYKQKFNKIYEEHVEKIYRFVYIKVSSKETAEDLTSHTFTKAWQAIKSGTEIKNPKAFVYQIARNLVIDFYRGKAKHSTIPEEFINSVPDNSVSIEKQVQFSSDLDNTMELLSKLKPEYQDVVVWHYLDDLSIKEIAKILEKTEDNIRVTLHRALNSLKEEAKKL